MKILVDAMGGDNAPLCVLQGVSQAAAEFGDGMELVLLGEEKAIRDCAKENKIDLAPFEILNCTETIDMHDDPVKAVRHKKDSSLVKGLTMLKNGEADAFVSAGSTGALHVGTSLIVRTVKGVKRPALATCMPGKKQPFLLLDDPFVNLDDARTKRALELLQKISQQRQVVYLVCNSARV